MSKSLFETHLENWEANEEITVGGVAKVAIYYTITHPVSVLFGILGWVVSNPIKFIFISSFLLSFFDAPTELLKSILVDGIYPETFIPDQVPPELVAR